VKQINEGVVSKLVKSGFDTILKILGASVEQLRCIPTFKDKMSNRIFNNIHETLKNVCIPDLMYASGCFGFGLAKRRINLLFNSIPTLLEHDVKIEDIEKVEGFSTKSASKIVENMESFKKFLQDISQYIHIQNNITKSLSLQDNKYVFSGFRDKELEDYIVSNGGSVVASVSSKTTCVVVPDITSTSLKIEKAKELNIPIILKSEIYNFFN
jgi:NAD-dependent DNA ligase